MKRLVALLMFHCLGFSLAGASTEIGLSSFLVNWVERSPERWILEINIDSEKGPQGNPESNSFWELSPSNLSSPFIVSQYGMTIPIYSQWISYPDGSQPKVKVEVQRERASLMEAQKFNPLNTLQISSSNEEMKLIESAHNEVSWWARIDGPYHIGGTRWGILEITPYQWDEQDRVLYKAIAMRIEIEWEASQMEQQRLRRESYAWQEVLRGLDVPIRDLGERMDLLGHYVIILPHQDRAIQAVAPLVEWKRKMGYEVTVVTTQEVGNTAESIKGWLNRAWQEWALPPTYVLLVGEEQGELRMPTFFDGAQPQMSWYMSDQKFVQFEGQGDNNPDMWIPEAFIGRLPAGNIQELQRMVNKIIGYERTPFSAQPWVEGAVLIAQGVRSCIHTNIAIKEILRAFGYSNDRFYEAYNDYPQEVDHNIINRGVDRGVGFVNFRGYNNWANYTPAQIRDRRNGWKMPLVFGMVCATNDWSNRYAPNEAIGEAWLRAWQNNEPAGAVACFGPTDLYTHTWFNNTMDGELFHQLINRKVHSLGPLTILSKLALLRNYPSYRTLGNGLTVGYYFFTYNILGDPSLQIRTREPQRIEVEFSDHLPLGTRWLRFSVRDEQQAPVPGAYIHILGEEVRYGGWTDGNGFLALEVPSLEEGTYSITVTGPNIIPFEDEFEVTRLSAFGEIVSWNWIDQPEEGRIADGDGRVEQGETGQLVLNLKNWGTDTLSQIYAELRTSNPYVTLWQDNCRWQNLGPSEEQEGTPVRITVDPQTPDGTVATIQLRFRHRGGEFESYLDIPIKGYQLQFVEPIWAEDMPLLPGMRAFLKVRVANRGIEPTDSLNGILYCSEPGIQIVQAESPLGVIPAEGNRLAHRWFELLASPQAFSGAAVSFGLLLRDELSRQDSVIFTLPLGPLTPYSPQGPDSYGYWCIDSRDTATGQAPRYQRLRGQNRLNLTDDDDRNNPRGDHGMRAMVDLPFEFLFYGERFSRITVSTNGWLSFGESDQVGWNNQELGSPLAPPALVAAYWNDLWGGTVWTNYEEGEGRFVVEWRGFQSERGGPISFTIALYDPTVYYTRTGDGLIEIHYAEFPARNLIGRDYQEEDVTIGICSPDRQSILQVAFAGRYHPATANLTAGMALRFTTGPYTRYGAIEGWVTDAASGMPLSAVRLMVDGTGLFSLTDRDGYFLLPQVPTGTHSITAFRLFFNRATRDSVEVRENETTSLEFALTHPLFSTDVEGIDMVVPPQGEDSLSFTVWNDGNGPLNYTLKVKPITEEPRRWDQLFDFNVSEICSSNTWIQGVATDGNLFYLSAKNNVQNNFPHWVYIVNREGELVGRFDQYTVDSTASRGYAAMDWKGDNLVVVEKNNLLEITPEGQLVRLIPTPERPAQSVAYSWDRGTLFTKSVTGRTLFELDFEGQIVATYRTPEAYRSYGMAWFPADPEGYFLYMFCNNPNALAEFGTVMQVWKMNPATGDFKLVKNIVLNEGDNAQDCAITRHWDPLRWIFIALVNRPGGDHLVGFDLGPNYSWISFRPSEGSLLPGFHQRFWVKFIAGDLPENTYRVYLTIQHNAEGEEYNIPVWFTVGWDSKPIPVESPVPKNLQLTAFPNPFNSTLQIRYALPEESFVNADLVDIQGRVVASAFSGNVLPGYHQTTLRPHHLPSGVYWLRLSTHNRTIIQKVVLLR